MDANHTTLLPFNVSKLPNLKKKIPTKSYCMGEENYSTNLKKRYLLQNEVIPYQSSKFAKFFFSYVILCSSSTLVSIASYLMVLFLTCCFLYIFTTSSSHPNNFALARLLHYDPSKSTNSLFSFLDDYTNVDKMQSKKYFFNFIQLYPSRKFSIRYSSSNLNLNDHQVISDDSSKIKKYPKVGGNMPEEKPSWFRVPAPNFSSDSNYTHLKEGLKKLNLHTVCEEACCPNIGDCWSEKTATIMILGDTCTRGCKFCAVKTSQKPPPPDPNEPLNTAIAINDWGLNYVVITSVDRDDMPDGGADHFAKTIEFLKVLKPEIIVECLVSDFQGMKSSVKRLATCGLNVYAHNVETVRRLQHFVRDKRTNYDQSIEVLRLAKEYNPNILTKSSMMLGLGEVEEEVFETMQDLRKANVDVITFGQYLRPSKNYLNVVEYIKLEQFQKYKEEAEKMGFSYAVSGPLIRSSYKAGEHYMTYLVKKKLENPGKIENDPEKPTFSYKIKFPKVDNNTNHCSSCECSHKKPQDNFNC